MCWCTESDADWRRTRCTSTCCRRDLDEDVLQLPELVHFESVLTRGLVGNLVQVTLSYFWTNTYGKDIDVLLTGKVGLFNGQPQGLS